MLDPSAITSISAVAFDPGFPAYHTPENSALLQGAGAEDFVLAEGFEGGGGHAGDGNRAPNALKTSIEYPAVPSEAMCWSTSLTMSPRRRRCSGTSASKIEWLKRATIGHFTSRNGLPTAETDQLTDTSFKLNCAEVAPNVPIDSLQTL